MQKTSSHSITFRILLSITCGFVVLLVVIWFFKEDIDLAVVPESMASSELNISSVAPDKTDTDDLLPSQEYAQSLLSDPSNFDTKKFEQMLPAQSLMHSQDMFLMGF